MRQFCLLLMLLVTSGLTAAEDFRISDIRVDGLLRLSEGSIFSYVPLEVGDTMTPALARSTIRDLWATGFFDDVTLEREGNVLVVQVEERPAISGISITGNRQIKDDDLIPALESIGIAEGEIFNKLELDRVKQELIQQYYSRGYYAVDVETLATELSRNRVNLSIIVKEGKQARIRHINIVGNETFSEKELRKEFESDSKLGLFFWRGANKYTREKLSGDLEALRSFYMDRGYLDFSIESTQVSISPDKSDIFVTANIREGDVYTVSDTMITGDLILDEKSIRSLVMVEPGDTFSRKDVEQSADNIIAVLGNIGYAFADVNPMPRLNRDTDLSDIFVTANIREGDVYTVSDTMITGDLILDEKSIRSLVMVEPGDTFSRKDVEQSADNIIAVLGNIGYAFADVNPMPRLNRDTLETEINFFIDPGKRVYVRRIEFRGNAQTKDEVLRREMRQFAGAWLSQAAIDRSKLRLQQLGYFDNVNVETPAVDGTDDQIDVVISVKEVPSGNFQVGFGYSQYQGLMTSVSIQQDNFLGSGRKVGFAVSRSSIYTQAMVNYTNPYYTDNGVSRGFYARYSEFDQARANISSFSTSQAAGGVTFGFPFSEVDYLRFGLGAQQMDINMLRGTCMIDPEGDPDDPDNYEFCTPASRPLAITLDENQDGRISGGERRITTYRLDGTWSRDSRNHYLNPTRGSLHRFGAEVALPGSSREFYRLNYRFRKYWPIGDRGMAFSLRGDVAHGDSYDNYDKKLGLEPVEDRKSTRLNSSHV